MNDGVYLIWSAEHGAWWGPVDAGYVQRISDAGRYSHAAALLICIKAMPGDARRMGALPELPVALVDVEHMIERYDAVFPHRTKPEPWE
jgi:hypothetical protein